jgi:hypothetical protein
VLQRLLAVFGLGDFEIESLKDSARDLADHA